MGLFKAYSQSSKGTNSSHEPQCIYGLFVGTSWHCSTGSPGILATRISSTLSEILSNNFNHFVYAFLFYIHRCIHDALLFGTKPVPFSIWKRPIFIGCL